ncbi:hypothetical protein HK098_001564 [Nowakowskiella sp. JEL0407]|nr:hypothetical protein HK098_001564 [Nowakowskiella sp. JEL0407]
MPNHQYEESRRENKTLLVGIFTTHQRFNRRALIRSTYLSRKPSDVDVYFVICETPNPKNDNENEKISLSVLKRLVEYEQSTFGDILILDGLENMNEGKTFSYFNQVARTFGKNFKDEFVIRKPAYHFVMKADDDVVLNLNLLAGQLRKMKDMQGAILGREVIGFGGRKFMAGMGYLLSFDLVLHISNSSTSSEYRIGQEDGLLSSWLLYDAAIQKWVTASANAFHDSPKSGGGWSTQVSSRSILVHQCKRDDWFVEVWLEMLTSSSSK